MMNSLRLYVVFMVMSLIPPTRAFALKRALLRWAGADVGKNVRIVSSARFYLGGKLSIGDDTWIGHEVLIVGGEADVAIGARVNIAPRVTLVTGSHELFTSPTSAAGAGQSKQIVIRDGVWIGCGVTIIGGTTLGTCCVVGAGALVNQSVESKTLVAGVPARFVKRFEF